MRLGNAAGQVVGHQDLGHAPQRVEAVHMGADPVREGLGGDGLGVDVAGRPEGGHEDLGLKGHLVGGPVVDGKGLAREVDEQLLAGPMVLAHDQVDPTPEGAVVVAELGVGVAALRVGLLVLEPQQHEGHAFAAEFLVDVVPVRHGPLRGRGHRDLREQGRLQLGVAHPLGQGPAQPGRLGPAEVIGHGGEGDPQGGAHLTAGQALTHGQPQDVSDLAHGETGSRHSHLLGELLPSDGGGPAQLRRGPCRASSGVYENPRNRCTESARTAVRNGPESAFSPLRWMVGGKTLKRQKTR